MSWGNIMCDIRRGGGGGGPASDPRRCVRQEVTLPPDMRDDSPMFTLRIPITRLRQGLSRVRPWVAALAFLSIVLPVTLWR